MVLVNHIVKIPILKV